jgi:hypothetical protein
MSPVWPTSEWAGAVVGSRMRILARRVSHWPDPYSQWTPGSGGRDSGLHGGMRIQGWNAPAEGRADGGRDAGSGESGSLAAPAGAMGGAENAAATTPRLRGPFKRQTQARWSPQCGSDGDLKRPGRCPQAPPAGHRLGPARPNGWDSKSCECGHGDAPWPYATGGPWRCSHARYYGKLITTRRLGAGPGITSGAGRPAGSDNNRHPRHEQVVLG